MKKIITVIFLDVQIMSYVKLIYPSDKIYDYETGEDLSYTFFKGVSSVLYA